MSRKDDPVLNVKFVQLVESHPCLWNSTLPAYSKKEEIQKAWHDVANETKDTVRNCRERWRTIRSSFLRSLKLAHTSTGRGKRNYYLAKYLQFLIPYTKSRHKPGNNIITLRKASSLPPMTRISHMPMPIVNNEDTKDSYSTSEVAIAEEDVMVSLQEDATLNQQHHQHLIAIKTEQDNSTSESNEHSATTTTTTTLTALAARKIPTTTHGTIQAEIEAVTTANGYAMDMTAAAAAGAATSSTTTTATPTTTTSTQHQHQQYQQQQQQQHQHQHQHQQQQQQHHQHQQQQQQQQRSSTSTVDLTEFAEWIKSKNVQQRHCLLTSSPDADQSFLNSLHPFLKEMSGKQNRRFRQKVVGLIDAILDNIE